jgi:hypothetical protein
MLKLKWFTLITLLLMSSCSPQISEFDLATIVAGTLQANQPTDAGATATVTDLQAAYGTVEGNICFPSEGIPPMNLFFLLEGTGQVNVFPIQQNQNTFSFGLPTGNYTAFAWLPDYTIGGSYSQAVACGLTVDCSDHSLLTFTVASGETISGIDVCDWYGGEGSVPRPEGVVVPVLPPVSATGSISGSLSFPSEFIPSMQVVAFDVNNGGWYTFLTAEGSGTYQIDNLPVGTYFIVSYLVGQDYGGGYSAAVPCGLSVECTDHSLLAVEVVDGQVTSNINPGDWYAPENTFPENPN